MLDSTTVQFGWDPPLPTDEASIRGVLKGYQVRLTSISFSSALIRIDRNVST